MHKPKAISNGSRIGIVTPGRGMPPEDLEQCIQIVKSLGFVPALGKHAHERLGYFGGPHANRAADVMAMFADDRVDAIWCTNGGFGCERLHALLDFEAIRRHPKLFIGHSNVDQLHYMIHKFAFPWSVCFQNLIGLVRMDGAVRKRSMDCFLKIAGGTGEPWEMPLADVHPPVKTLVPGTVRAPIHGGCEMNYTLATPWEVDLDGKVAVLDISSENGLWSKWLAQLHNARKLQRAAGFIVITQTGHTGVPSEWGRVDLKAQGIAKQTLRDYLDEFITPLNKPTLMDVPMEHSCGALPIPYGAMVEMNASERRITVLEDIVRR